MPKPLLRSTTTRIACCFGGAVIIASASCQIFVPTDVVQCYADTDCTTRGGDFASTVCVDSLCVLPGDRCIGKVAEAIEDRALVLHSRLRFADVGGTPVRGIEVLVCASLDEACDAPVGSAVTTDAEGYAYLTLWKNFRGTIQVKNLPAASDYLKVKLHVLTAFEVDDPPTKTVPIASSVRLLSRKLLELQLGARAVVDPNAGQIIASAVDCDTNPRAGVNIEVRTERTGSPIPFYFTDESLVSADATVTGKGGLFGVANAPAGPMMIEASIPSIGKKLGRVEVWVNKDTISNFALGPTANP